jgi:DNA-binding response OmpR family regulator
VTSKVLIADDDPVEAEMLTEFLRDTVGEIQVVTESARVEHVFRDYEPDLVILDLHMPPPDGFEVLRRLRGLRDRIGYLPVIVLTADETDLARNTSLILGADEFITKPVDREEIVLRARNLLRTRELFVASREGRRPQD